MLPIQPQKSGDLDQENKKKELASSKEATQLLSSEKELLETYLKQADYRFKNIPILGRIQEYFFGNEIAKKEYLKQLHEKAPTLFIDNFKQLDMVHLQRIEHIIEAGGIALFDSSIFQFSIEHLLKVPEKNFPILTAIIHEVTLTTADEQEQSMILLEWLKAAREENFFEDAKAFHIDPILTVKPENREALKEMVRLEPQISQMLGSTFTSEDRKNYIEACFALEKNQSKDFLNISQRFKGLCSFLKSIQNQRPKIYSSNEEVATLLNHLGNQFEYGKLLSQLFNSPLSSLCNELCDRTFSYNVQVLGENIGSFIVSPEENSRHISSLNKRTKVPYSLSQEFHPDLTLYKDSDQKVSMTGISTRLSITNDKTGETRTLRSPLPITGEMTQTEARKQLKLLWIMIDTPSDFEDKYEEIYPQADSNSKMKMKREFERWVDENIQNVYKLIFDFNATDTRPKFSYIREQDEVKQAIQNVLNEKMALQVAKGQNLFLVNEDTLSLLPPEIFSNYPEIGQISQQTLGSVREALRERNAQPVNIHLHNKDGALTVRQTSTKIRGEDYIEVEMTIQQEELSHTRKGLIKGSEIQSYLDSKRLERDILLTQSEFFEKNY